MLRRALIALVLMVAGGCGGPPVGPASRAGWRWESYGGVEVRVPADWGWGNGNQRLSQWCVRSDDGVPPPIVARPGYQTLAGCSAMTKPAPETLVAATGLVVAFSRTAEGDGERHEGDQTQVRRNGVLVTVNAPEGLRERIAGTVRAVDVDSFGCPSSHRVSDRPALRPALVPVTSLRQVSSVSVCKFGITSRPEGRPERLLSAARLEGAAAERAVRGIVAAPVGGGPDDPGACLAEYAYGDQIIVLLVRSAAGVTELVVRYAGCDHNGFDDGVSVRSLTPAATAPFLAGPNTVVDGVSFGW